MRNATLKAASMLISLDHKSQVQTQQPRRAEDRKAFDYIPVLWLFEVLLKRVLAS
jgi:hypothetical protein